MLFFNILIGGKEGKKRGAKGLRDVRMGFREETRRTCLKEKKNFYSSEQLIGNEKHGGFVSPWNTPADSRSSNQDPLFFAMMEKRAEERKKI